MESELDFLLIDLMWSTQKDKHLSCLVTIVLQISNEHTKKKTPHTHYVSIKWLLNVRKHFCNTPFFLVAECDSSDERGVKVRQLDWTTDDFLTDADSEFGWSEDEISDLYDNTTVIIAADVCYDNDLTDALFRTLYRISSNLRHSSTAYISIEKRLNFTLRHMDVSCETYDHFRHCLEQITELREKKMRFTVSPVSCSFPQFFQYERVNQLELWKVSVNPFQTLSSSTTSQKRGENDATSKTNPDAISKSWCSALCCYKCAKLSELSAKWIPNVNPILCN